MTTRKPIVLINGRAQELPVGDVITGGVFPFFKADGTPNPISLTAAGALPFFKASGTASDIPLTA